MIRLLTAAGLAGVLATPGEAVTCRLALALAIDVSSSVDANEDALQRGGLASALRAPEVERAFFSSPLPVALAAYEWSGRFNQQVLMDWRLIETPADLEVAANVVGLSKRGQTEFPTAMGHAVAFAARLFQRAPDCLFRTLDIAGDGVNNDGYGPRTAYTHFAFQNVIVNGLAINGSDFEGEINLIPFYQTEVLHGPGAFLEIAQGFEDYERAMRRKLERELSGMVLGATTALDGQ